MIISIFEVSDSQNSNARNESDGVLVVYKLEFDAKSRGRSRKSIKKIYYINGGTQV